MRTGNNYSGARWPHASRKGPAGLPFNVGDRVRVVSHYTWCNEDMHGAVGVIRSITEYEPEIVAGGALYMFYDHGSPIPLTAADIESVA